MRAANSNNNEEMNKYNAKDYMPLVQGLAEGKTIQFKSEQWEDIPCNSEFKWNNCPSHYRIKPEPRTFEMWLSKGGCMYPLGAFSNPQPDIERITVQEVLE